MRCQKCKREGVPLIINSRRKNNAGEILIGYMCRVCNTERAKQYRRTTHGKERVYAAVKKSMKKHWDKQVARRIVNDHVRSGKIVKPSHCSRCLQEKPVEGHHTDYTKPLEVVWVCRQCHSDLERVVHISSVDMSMVVER